MTARTTERIMVSFSGDGAGEEELTWGQRGLWQTIVASGESKTMGGIDPLPPGTTVQDAVATLRFVLSRHHSLRTRLRLDPDRPPRQVVAGSGEAALEIVDAEPDDDPAAVAAQVLERYQGTKFDYAHEWPVRMALVRQHGRPTHAIAVYLHLALDAHGLLALLTDLSTMDRRTGTSPLPVTAIQPLALARQQRTPAAQRQCAASLQHLERVLRGIPAQRFRARDGVPESSYRQIRYSSPALRLAGRLVAARSKVDTTPVLLAGYAVAATRLTGSNPFVTVLAVSNRFRPGFAGSVSLVAQVSPCVLDIAGITFAEAVARTARAAMSAYKYAYYDPDQRIALIEAVGRDRGEPVDLSCFFNDRRQEGRAMPTGPLPTPAEIRAALPDSRQQWDSPPGLPQQKLYLSVDDVPGAAELTMSADNRYLSPDDMVGIVRGIEAVVVEAAADPDAPTGVPADPASGGAG